MKGLVFYRSDSNWEVVQSYTYGTLTRASTLVLNTPAWSTYIREIWGTGTTAVYKHIVWVKFPVPLGVETHELNKLQVP